MSISSLNAVKTGCNAKLQFRDCQRYAKLEFRATFGANITNSADFQPYVPLKHCDSQNS
ncbi:hypothetical protein U27_05379 [Candidatus Vecturithrix granuli]|uniref:Uncharacterized protein n=1 Tax=Vecturithrix granuli TaxID=1499967 RepID=A0A081C1F0_VECG1|nr:hypothetical protein U27_05379 [Candidatus Vecturithrix granuli]